MQIKSVLNINMVNTYDFLQCKSFNECDKTSDSVGVGPICEVGQIGKYVLKSNQRVLRIDIWNF